MVWVDYMARLLGLEELIVRAQSLKIPNYLFLYFGLILKTLSDILQ